MITRRTALFNRNTRAKIFHDIHRARAIAAYRREGMSIPEISDALNASQPVLKQLLLELATQSPGIQRQVPDSRDCDLMSHYTPFYLPRTERGIAGDQERRATRLAEEITLWLGQFEVADVDRLAILREARSSASRRAMNSEGNYIFSVFWAVRDVLGIWRPAKPDPAVRDFSMQIARWLASWLRFWIADPRVLDWAFDLSSARLIAGDQPLAA